MALDIAINLLKEVFLNTDIFGSSWIYQLMILFGSLIIITRVWKDWMDLALPVIMGWKIIGYQFSNIIFAVAGMLFVINVLSIKEIVSGLNAVKGFATYIRESSRVKRKYDKAMSRMENEEALRHRKAYISAEDTIRKEAQRERLFKKMEMERAEMATNFYGIKGTTKKTTRKEKREKIYSQILPLYKEEEARRKRKKKIYYRGGGNEQ